MSNDNEQQGPLQRAVRNPAQRLSEGDQAARRAIEIDKHILAVLRMMWDPDDPSTFPGDDDWEVFNGNPEFDALLRM